MKAQRIKNSGRLPVSALPQKSPPLKLLLNHRRHNHHVNVIRKRSVYSNRQTKHGRRSHSPKRFIVFVEPRSVGVRSSSSCCSSTSPSNNTCHSPTCCCRCSSSSSPVAGHCRAFVVENNAVARCRLNACGAIETRGFVEKVSGVGGAAAAVRKCHHQAGSMGGHSVNVERVLIAPSRSRISVNVIQTRKFNTLQWHRV